MPERSSPFTIARERVDLIPDLALSPTRAEWLRRTGALAVVHLMVGDPRQAEAELAGALDAKLAGRDPVVRRLEAYVVIEFRVGTLDDDEWACAAEVAAGVAAYLDLPEDARTGVRLSRLT
ncbi:hypothetical protein [Pimelobacter sp. 30-1]|uniref:hypothetical protein n=1 Tax=Pimelobacter sp. 30-1 TaxID=2004991 RepID=UPI001C05BA76|nr:hypothetical protein [Pimelobacter sp. 30-1]